jgi:hypothetical protein
MDMLLMQVRIVLDQVTEVVVVQEVMQVTLAMLVPLVMLEA